MTLVPKVKSQGAGIWYYLTIKIVKVNTSMSGL